MTDIFLVTDYTLFNFIPHIIIPFVFGLLIIGFVTRFIKNGLNI